MADILKIDFNQTGPSPTQAGWLSAITPGSGVPVTVGAYTVTYTGGVDRERDRGALAVNTTPVGFSDLYRDFWFTNPGTFTVAIDGFTPSTDYDVRLFGFDKNNKNNDFEYVDITTDSYGLTGSVFNGGSDPTTDFQSSVVVRVKSDTTGRIIFRAQSNGGTVSLCNGLIVSTVAVGGPPVGSVKLSAYSSLSAYVRM